ncbi:unnamed protein product [Notodromas monacha]|uniref:Uncharacterized protein n=1 Tax=Notodromas monacha TaxID=399045 RepID=A0A7R9BPR0_9CRUS|nr:unnamed protein product [Notodromas monacha]CAG0918317.1 unnamed protein product [Notodromas monacha]
MSAASARIAAHEEEIRNKEAEIGSQLIPPPPGSQASIKDLRDDNSSLRGFIDDQRLEIESLRRFKRELKEKRELCLELETALQRKVADNEMLNAILRNRDETIRELTTVADESDRKISALRSELEWRLRGNELLQWKVQCDNAAAQQSNSPGRLRKSSSAKNIADLMSAQAFVTPVRTRLNREFSNSCADSLADELPDWVGGQEPSRVLSDYRISNGGLAYKILDNTQPISPRGLKMQQRVVQTGKGSLSIRTVKKRYSMSDSHRPSHAARIRNQNNRHSIEIFCRQ